MMLDAMRRFFSRDENAPVYPRFAVPMPEAGKDAYLSMYEVDTLAALEAALGGDYWRMMQVGFLSPSSLVISRALAICLRNAEPDGAPWGLSLEELGRRLYDAQLRAWKGVTLAEAEQIVAEYAAETDELAKREKVDAAIRAKGRPL